MNRYRVNEIFYSVQGEGLRTGTPNVFVRFSGCNMDCHEGHENENADFNCDTEFVSGRWMTTGQILDYASELCPSRVVPAVIFTGGEPLLQLDAELVQEFKSAGAFVAIETNGTLKCELAIDWITCSPKIAEHCMKLTFADEIKYVRHHGQGIPKPNATANHYLISPAFDGPNMNARSVAWCNKLVLENPKWRLSLQTHKLTRVR